MINVRSRNFIMGAVSLALAAIAYTSHQMLVVGVMAVSLLCSVLIYLLSLLVNRVSENVGVCRHCQEHSLYRNPDDLCQRCLDQLRSSR